VFGSFESGEFCLRADSTNGLSQDIEYDNIEHAVYERSSLHRSDEPSPIRSCCLALVSSVGPAPERTHGGPCSSLGCFGVQADRGRVDALAERGADVLEHGVHRHRNRLPSELVLAARISPVVGRTAWPYIHALAGAWTWYRTDSALCALGGAGVGPAARLAAVSGAIGRRCHECWRVGRYGWLRCGGDSHGEHHQCGAGSDDRSRSSPGIHVSLLNHAFGMCRNAKR
jgi:hypothetical protein